MTTLLVVLLPLTPDWDTGSSPENSLTDHLDSMSVVALQVLRAIAAHRKG